MTAALAEVMLAQVDRVDGRRNVVEVAADNGAVTWHSTVVHRPVLTAVDGTSNPGRFGPRGRLWYRSPSRDA